MIKMATMAMRSSSRFARILRLDARSPQLGVRFSSSQSQVAGDTSEDLTHESIFTEQHVEMRRSLNKLIEKEINPFVDQWEAEKQFPSHEVFKKLGDAGFLGLNKPIEYGGLGLDFSYNIAMAEELGNIKCGGIPMAIGVQSDMATPALARFGSDELKRQFLAPTIAGDVVACLGVSEVGSGSDVASIQTKAEKQGGDYIINGGKMWITNGIKSDWICLLANTGTGPAHQNKSLICVPMDTKGVVRAQNIDKIGMWCSDTAQLYFEDVRVPQKNLIGQEGMGFTYQMLQFQEERMWAMAAALQPLEILINETVAYTKQRKAFGKSILDNQVVHYRLAEMQTEVELLRSLLYRTIGLYIQGKDVTKLASMGKLKTGRLCREISDSCLQYWGGMGFTTDALVSRYYRDFRLISIGGGADEVMLSIISKYMGTLPTPPKKK
ncbi:probable acyl-CoA dehydrogenase 6 [Patiria miniata]|uniref:Acyl-CoA dehydrogenase 6 n=1 Tax=Patiria miniata TaxID=46514 RepID=A0A914BQ03_PATMI|nr:probable acyl-CoA dehydrogenase 6 [Patiria miniata]